MPGPHPTLSLTLPSPGLKQAAQAFVADNGPAGRVVGRTMTLAELILEIKY